MNGCLTNLDSRCAQYSYNIIKSIDSGGTLSKNDRNKLETIITKSLGVLQENGLYAFFLFLDYRKNELGAEKMKEHSISLLSHEDIGLLNQTDDPLISVQQITENLSRLILSHRLIEQMLIYARYHAKALRVTT